MSRHFLTVGLVAVLLTSCVPDKKPVRPDYVTPPANFPHFRLMKVAKGHIADLTTEGQQKSGRSLIPEPDRIYGWIQGINNLSSAAESRAIKASVGPASTETTLQIISVDAKSLMVGQMATKSTKYRYYAGNSGIYCRRIDNPKIWRIFNRAMWSGFFKDDIIYTTISNGDGSSKVVKFGPKLPVTELFDGVVGEVGSVDSQENVIVNTLNTCGARMVGRPYKHLSFGLAAKLLHWNHQTFPIGLVWDDNFVTPVLWTADLRPVRLVDVCPGLAEAIKHYDRAANCQVATNEEGTVAIWIEASNRIGENSFSDFESFTYVLQAIP